MAQTTLLCLHGFSQNGAALRAHLQPLLARWPSSLEVLTPDAPNECSATSVERLYSQLGGPRLPPPHRCFWDASDDGREYRGLDASLSQLRAALTGAERVGVVGFSQGAMAAATLCGLAAQGQFPRVDFAVLVAGRVPRADALQHLFEQPIRLPSLHVWGERDAFAMEHGPLLVKRFDADQRRTATWNGPHVLPTRGVAADEIVAFVTAHADAHDARA